MAMAMRVAGNEESKGGKVIAMATRMAGKQTAAVSRPKYHHN